MKIKRIDHVGVIVQDLAAATSFFTNLGMEILRTAEVEGALVERIIGLDNVRDSIVILGVPGGETNIELLQFHSPPAVGDGAPLPANALGIRHICLAVEEIDIMIERLAMEGYTAFSEVVNYEGIKRLCYIRGPEGIIVELAEQVG